MGRNPFIKLRHNFDERIITVPGKRKQGSYHADCKKAGNYPFVIHSGK
jgi:hypothetical protein